MFAEGKRVEVTDGAFSGHVGVVISHEARAQQIAQQQAANPDFIIPPFSAPPDAVFVVITIWGRELVLELIPSQLRAVE